jgi:hypothetical protein
VARSTAYPLDATSSTLRATTSQSRSLRMTITRDHSKALDSRQLSNNFRHRMLPAPAV